MSPRPIAILAVAVILAIVGGLVLLGRGDDRVAAPLPADAAAGEVVVPGAPPGPESGDRRVRIAVRSVGKLVPLSTEPPAACRLVQNGRLVPSAVSVVAGPGPRQAVGRHLVRFELADRSSLWRVVDLAAEPCDLELFAPTLLEGQVVGEGGRPVVGASVWTGATAIDRSPILATTGADGRFVVTGIPGTRGVPVVVRAPGYASHWRAVDLEHPRTSPLLLQLATAAALEVLAVDVDPLHTKIAVRPKSDDLEIRHYPFFWSLLDPTSLVPDTSGMLRIGDLPRRSRVSVGLAAARLEEVVLREPVSRVVIRPWPAAVTGRLLDPDGVPRLGTRVLGPSAMTASMPGYLLPYGEVPGAVVDDHGRFRVRVPRDTSVELRIAVDERSAMLVSARAGDDLGDLFLGADVGPGEPGEPMLCLELPAPGGSQWHARLEGVGELRWQSESVVAIALPDPSVVDVEVRVGAEPPLRWRGVPVLRPRTFALTP